MDIDNRSTYLSLSPAPANRYSRPILAMAAAGLLLLGLSTVIAVTGGFGRRVSSATLVSPSPQTRDDSSAPRRSEAPSQNLQRIDFPSRSRVLRTVAKGKEAALALDQSTQPKSRNPSVTQEEMKSAEQPGVGSSIAKPDTDAHEKQTTQATAEVHSVKVVLQIEGGRVAKASIANHRSGMEAYEALALRIARQRRYPSKGATQETVTIKLGSPE